MKLRLLTLFAVLSIAMTTLAQSNEKYEIYIKVCKNIAQYNDSLIDLQKKTKELKVELNKRKLELRDRCEEFLKQSNRDRQTLISLFNQKALLPQELQQRIERELKGDIEEPLPSPNPQPQPKEHEKREERDGESEDTNKSGRMNPGKNKHDGYNPEIRSSHSSFKEDGKISR